PVHGFLPSGKAAPRRGADDIAHPFTSGREAPVAWQSVLIPLCRPDPLCRVSAFSRHDPTSALPAPVFLFKVCAACEGSERCAAGWKKREKRLDLAWATEVIFAIEAISPGGVPVAGLQVAAAAGLNQPDPNGGRVCSSGL